MRKSDYYRAWLLGVVTGMAFLALFYMVNVAIDTKDEPVPPPEPSSKVVDTYKGCDIIQWSDNHLATYKYFLYCPK